VKLYDKFGQRMTDCCNAFATFGEDVTLQNIDSVQMTCRSCGQPVSKGEGDQTEFLPGVTYHEWLQKFMDDGCHSGRST